MNAEMFDSGRRSWCWYLQRVKAHDRSCRGVSSVISAGKGGAIVSAHEKVYLAAVLNRSRHA